MPKGIVVSFERNSGFGFIESEEGERLFVHHTGIGDPDRHYLVPGQRVEFNVSHTERGPRAENVHVTAEVALKAQRNLDWRHRRGKRPRPGDIPRRSAAPAEEDAEEGVLRARFPTPASEKPQE
jgi:CspA family cold shock protein